jgi:outer membrane protein
MKNVSLALNVLLFLAVAFLYFDRFSGPKKTAPAAESTTVAADGKQSLNIVYINLDSLHAKSTTFQSKKTELEKRQADAEGKLQGRAAAFKKEVEAYAQKAQGGTMTPKQMQDEEERLGKKEQSIMQEQERLGKALMEEMDKFNESFTNEVKGYLDSLKAEMKYDYILVYGTGSPVLVANDELDITAQVLELLNKKQ